MNSYTIIHNPRCSKSRATLELLSSNGIEPQIIEYLNEELSFEFLSSIFDALKMRPKDCLRTKEDEFKSLSIDLESDKEVIEAIQKYPKILERPIVVKGNRAVIGRPPENVLSLI